MEKDAKIYVAGHRGLLGSALVKSLFYGGYRNIITRDKDQLDLTNQSAVATFFSADHPDYVFLAAAKVGSISANIKYPAEFIYQNSQIAINIINCARVFGARKLLFYGSNCMYPWECSQPMKEEYLYSGLLEPTNRPYAVAKLAGLELCLSYNAQYAANFIVPVLASLYGPNDHFGTSRAHVIADMIEKLCKARSSDLKEIVFWGDGSPLREFMFVEDAADASIFLMKNSSNLIANKDQALINIGTAEEISMLNLSLLIAGIVGYTGKISWDVSKPNGMPRKLLDSSKFYKLGWHPKTSLENGIRKTVHWYLDNIWSN